MKILRIFFKTVFFISLIISIGIFAVIFFLQNNISNTYKIKRGEELKFTSAVPITAVYEGALLSQSSKTERVGEEFKVKLKAFGIIPFTTADVEVVDEMFVEVLGTPFGMKLYTEGVLVIDISSVDTENGKKSPAETAGIKIGDYILSVNGKKITTNEELSGLVEASSGNILKFKIKRNGAVKNISLKPVLSRETESYKIGLWVRDSSAGIGTATFYSPATGVFCGLGHGVCDEDTGELLALNSGELVTAEIIDTKKGTSGSPGMLKGRFKLSTIGSIDINSRTGVYSLLKGQINVSKLTEIALKQEIKDGAAEIITTVKGETPKKYSCKIKVRRSAYHSTTQNMTVTVTDEELLNITGGIVQGMSGSPIIQNGKLIGAVTHVLIDNSAVGYGIFAENMLETSRSVEQLKEAG